MKESTKEKIIKSALVLFSENYYHDVSVLEICKHANVSNGIFYNYFNTKEEVFLVLLEETINRIAEYFKGIKGRSVEERLKSFIDINLELTKNEFRLIKVYREGQYEFIDYEKKIKKTYKKALEFVYGRKLNKYEFFFLISGLRFINTYYIPRNLNCDSNFVVRVLMYGIGQELRLNINDLDDFSFYLRVPYNSSNVRCAFLNTGLDILSTTSFSNFRVQDLMKKLSLSIGTFYNHFKDKNEFLKILLLRIRKQLFYYLKDNYIVENSFMDNYLLFLYLLFEYYKEAPYKYTLLREFEFIYPHLYNRFIDEDINFYVQVLLHDLLLTKEKKNLLASLLLGYNHYMGIEFFYLKNFNDKKEFFNHLMNFLENGIRE